MIKIIGDHIQFEIYKFKFSVIRSDNLTLYRLNDVHSKSKSTEVMVAYCMYLSNSVGFNPISKLFKSISLIALSLILVFSKTFCDFELIITPVSLGI